MIKNKVVVSVVVSWKKVVSWEKPRMSRFLLCTHMYSQ